MEKIFLLIQNNEVKNVTVGVSLEETKKHFPDFEVEEYVSREKVIEKYGYNRFFENNVITVDELQ